MIYRAYRKDPEDVVTPLVESLKGAISADMGDGSTESQLLSLETSGDAHAAVHLPEVRAEYHAKSKQAYQDLVRRLDESLVAISPLLPRGWSQSAIHQLSEALRSEDPACNNIELHQKQSAAIGNLQDSLNQYEGSPSSLSKKELDTVLSFISSLPAIREGMYAGNDAYREERLLIASLPAYELACELSGATSSSGSQSFNSLGKSVLEEIQIIRENQSNIKFLSDMPRISADGLTRTRIHYQEPRVLRALRQRDGLDPVECEVCVIGGGPGGISAAIHLGEQGVDTVVLEAGYFGQAFSDARAKLVHQMRTDENLSSITQVGLVGHHMHETYGMARFLTNENLRNKAAEALQQLQESSGYECEFDSQNLRSKDDPSNPVRRSELFAYLAYLAQKASELPGVYMLEQAPVSSAHWDACSKRFIVKSAAGHELHAKKLVVGCGFVGPEAEWARFLPDIENLSSRHPDKLILIKNEHDLTSRNGNLKDFLAGSSSPSEGAARPQIVMSHALLGHSEMRQSISLLPEGTRAAVIGGGESAAKGALEILALNPRAKVDLFVSGRLEPYQYQFPRTARAGNPALRAIADPEFADEVASITRQTFRTPIVTDTMLTLLEEVKKGRIRIFELGEHFSSKSLDLKIKEHPQSRQVETHICLKAGESRVRQALVKQQSEWREYGVLPAGKDLISADSDTLSIIDGPLVIATGYDKRKLSAKHPLLQQLIKDGALSLTEDGTGIELDSQHGLSSKKCPELFFVGSVRAGSPFDTALLGISVRSKIVADALRDEDATRRFLRDYAINARRDEKVNFSSVLRQNGIADKHGHPSKLEPEIRFPGDGLLQQLADQPYRRQSPAVRLTLQRADSLQERVREALRAGPLKESWTHKIRSVFSEIIERFYS